MGRAAGSTGTWQEMTTFSPAASAPCSQHRKGGERVGVNTVQNTAAWLDLGWQPGVIEAQTRLAQVPQCLHQFATSCEHQASAVLS